MLKNVFTNELLQLVNGYENVLKNNGCFKLDYLICNSDILRK